MTRVFFKMSLELDEIYLIIRYQKLAHIIAENNTICMEPGEEQTIKTLSLSDRLILKPIQRVVEHIDGIPIKTGLGLCCVRHLKTGEAISLTNPDDTSDALNYIKEALRLNMLFGVYP